MEVIVAGDEVMCFGCRRNNVEKHEPVVRRGSKMLLNECVKEVIFPLLR